MSQKYLDLAGLTVYDGKLKEWFKSGVVDITEDFIRALFVTIAEGPADNEIWYTTVDGNIINNPYTGAFEANIIDNTYENGKGVITFDGEVTSIGEGAFCECYNLTSITIPNSVTSIGNYAFQLCADLTSVTIPNSVTSIGERAFENCSSLTSIIVESGNSTYDSRENCNAIIETATNTLIVVSQNTVIPNSVKSIGFEAFYGSSLSSINIPNSVTNIGDRCFMYSDLTSVTIPNSVTNIGNYAFGECDSLTSINFEGTVEQWNNIVKDDNWYGVPATYVQCTDGQVTLQ